MLALSPGLYFLLRAMLQNLIGPPAVIYGCYRLATLHKPDHWTPRFLRSPAGLLLAAFSFHALHWAFTSTRAAIRRRRAIRRLRAVPLRKVKGGKWPGNADIVWRFTKFFASEYLGEGFEIACRDNGDLFMFSVLGTDSVGEIHNADRAGG